MKKTLPYVEYGRRFLVTGGTSDWEVLAYSDREMRQLASLPKRPLVSALRILTPLPDPINLAVSSVTACTFLYQGNYVFAQFQRRREDELDRDGRKNNMHRLYYQIRFTLLTIPKMIEIYEEGLGLLPHLLIQGDSIYANKDRSGYYLKDYEKTEANQPYSYEFNLLPTGVSAQNLVNSVHAQLLSVIGKHSDSPIAIQWPSGINNTYQKLQFLDTVQRWAVLYFNKPITFALDKISQNSVALEFVTKHEQISSQGNLDLSLLEEFKPIEHLVEPQIFRNKFSRYQTHKNNDLSEGFRFFKDAHDKDNLFRLSIDRRVELTQELMEFDEAQVFEVINSFSNDLEKLSRYCQKLVAFYNNKSRSLVIVNKFLEHLYDSLQEEIITFWQLSLYFITSQKPIPTYLEKAWLRLLESDWENRYLREAINFALETGDARKTNAVGAKIQKNALWLPFVKFWYDDADKITDSLSSIKASWHNDALLEAAMYLQKLPQDEKSFSIYSLLLTEWCKYVLVKDFTNSFQPEGFWETVNRDLLKCFGELPEKCGQLYTNLAQLIVPRVRRSSLKPGNALQWVFYLERLVEDKLLNKLNRESYLERQQFISISSCTYKGLFYKELFLFRRRQDDALRLSSEDIKELLDSHNFDAFNKVLQDDLSVDSISLQSTSAQVDQLIIDRAGNKPAISENWRNFSKQVKDALFTYLLANLTDPLNLTNTLLLASSERNSKYKIQLTTKIKDQNLWEHLHSQMKKDGNYGAFKICTKDNSGWVASDWLQILDIVPHKVSLVVYRYCLVEWKDNLRDDRNWRDSPPGFWDNKNDTILRQFARDNNVANENIVGLYESLATPKYQLVHDWSDYYQEAFKRCGISRSTHPVTNNPSHDSLINFGEVNHDNNRTDKNPSRNKLHEWRARLGRATIPIFLVIFCVLIALTAYASYQNREVLLSAFGSPLPTTVVVSMSPTAVAQTPSETNAPTQIPTLTLIPSQTPTSPPTSTVTPSNTPIITPTPTLIPVPSQILTPTPDPELRSISSPYVCLSSNNVTVLRPNPEIDTNSTDVIRLNPLSNLTSVRHVSIDGDGAYWYKIKVIVSVDEAYGWMKENDIQCFVNDDEKNATETLNELLGDPINIPSTSDFIDSINRDFVMRPVNCEVSSEFANLRTDPIMEEDFIAEELPGGTSISGVADVEDEGDKAPWYYVSTEVGDGWMAHTVISCVDADSTIGYLNQILEEDR